jgi:hypothetical protein
MYNRRIHQLIATIAVVLLAACTPGNTVLKAQRKSWGFDTWEQQFKDRAFCLCMLEGYNNSAVKNFLLQHDKSMADPLAITFFDAALHGFISKEVETMKRDSAASILEVSEGAAGKRVFGHCLAFYKSERLDSLVRREAPKWRNIKNIEDSIMKRIPAF